MSLNCPRCNRSFSASPDYVDLTLTSGLKRKVLTIPAHCRRATVLACLAIDARHAS